MSNSASEVHAALRGGTAELHEAVERRMDLHARLRSAENYADLLRGFLQVLAPLETRLAGFAWPEALAMERRRKTPLLRADLADLGFALPANASGPAVGQPDLPCRATAFGCLYVLEGSTLGGRLILKEVQDRLGFDAGRGARFFAGYGKETGPMWASFLRVLAENVRSPDAIRRAVLGARETFRAMDLSTNAGPGVWAA